MRYYGLYSNKGKIPKQYLYSEKEDPDKWEELQVEKTGENPLICPHCKERKIYLYTTIKKFSKSETTVYKRNIFKHEKIPNKVAA